MQNHLQPSKQDGAGSPRLIYSFARISAALAMNVEDYHPQGKRWWVRLHEKGGKQHEMPAHHLLESYIDAYVTPACIGGEKTSPLFRTLGGRGRRQLEAKRMSDHQARLPHLPRDRHYCLFAQRWAAGIGQQMAAHESAHTTKLYDRRNDQVTLDQVERIVL
jgi:integrase